MREINLLFPQKAHTHAHASSMEVKLAFLVLTFLEIDVFISTPIYRETSLS